MKRAVIYTRVSTDKQDYDRQLNDLHTYADKNGYEIVGTFNDITSGTVKASDRKAAAAMFDFLEAEKVEMILITEISRLGRSTIDVQKTLDKLVFQMGLNVYTHGNGMTARKANGKIDFHFKLISDILANLAAMEREQISDRTRSKLDLKRKEYAAYNKAHNLKEGDKGFMKLGRPVGTKKTDSPERLQAFLKEYKKVVKELNSGTSIRNTAKICDVSPATVQKVKAALKTKKAAAAPSTSKELKGQRALSL